MALTHNSNIADSEPNWGSVDKTALPRQAFADPGEEDKKSTWGYPHHWVSGGSKKNKDGVWIDGTLYLHVGGYNAAKAAAGGARSGQKANSTVVAHLKGHQAAVEAYRKRKEAQSALVDDAKRRAETNKGGIIL